MSDGFFMHGSAGRGAPASRRAARRIARLGAQPPPPPTRFPTPAAQTFAHSQPEQADPAPVTTTSQPESSEDTTDANRRPAILIGVGGVLVLFVAAVSLVLAVFRSPEAPPAEVVERAPTSEGERAVQTPVRTERFAEAGVAPEEIGSPLRAMRRAVYEAEADPAGAMRLFANAVAAASQEWPESDRARRLATVELVVEFAHTIADDDEATAQAFAIIGAGATALAGEGRLDAQTVAPAAWSVGVLARLSRDRAISEAARTAMRSAARAAGLEGSGATTFDQGAAFALARAPARIGLFKQSTDGGPAAAWEAWLRSVDALTDETHSAETVLLDGAYAILRAARQRGGDATTHDLLGRVLSRLDWSEGAHARARLLDWFDDTTGVGTSELVFIHEWLRNEQPDGVSVSGEFSNTPRDRSRVREELASSWGLGRARVAPAIRDRWRVAAESDLAAQVATDDPLDALRLAARLSALSEAAATLWRGDSERARRIVDDLDGAVRGAPGRPRSEVGTLGGGGADGQWALEYLSERQSGERRIDILRKLLQRGGPLGPVDAETLIHSAMFGQPSEVRRIGRRVVEFRANDPAIINGMLEALPRAPRVESFASVVEAVAADSLPPIDDPAWALAARQRLLERLIEALTGATSLDAADRIAESMRDSYLGRLREEARSALPGETAPDGAAPQPPVVARAVMLDMLAEAADLGGPVAERRGEALARRQEARRSITSGSVAEFAVEAAGAAEALALVVAAERPERRHTADAIIDRLHEDLATAQSVVQQILAAERASLRLWALRFEGGGSA